jgi:Tol biopolymer transport system component
MHVSFFHAAVWLLLVCAASFSVEAAPHGVTNNDGAIVFTRSRIDSYGTVRRSSLSLTSSTGGTPGALTEGADGVIDDAATWSPNGMRIAFERGAAGADPGDRFDILMLDPQTRQVHQLTTGSGNFTSPVWGPRNRIAFVAQYRHRSCLSVIEVDGRQHDLFCPPSPATVLRPLWSADGANLYVQAGYYVDGIDGFWRSLAYRVDASTGAASVLDDQVLEGRMHLEFAPDGSCGIFSNALPYAADMALIDFAGGSIRSIGTGYAPRWSRDGRRIAFTGEVYESNPPDDFRYYEPLYVMDADGTHVRRITRWRADNHAYTAVDWSRDGAHLLLNRRIYLDPSLTVPRFAMRIVDVDSGAMTVLAGGSAQPGAWFER